MPIYEYYCAFCDDIFEQMQKVTERPLQKCPKCGKKLRRLISKSSFALKGSGWYKDSYSSPAPKSESKKADNASKEKESKKEGKES